MVSRKFGWRLMKLYYTDHFELPLPSTHRFPMSKYRQLRQAVVSSPHHRNDTLFVPNAASDEELLLCHDRDYLERVISGQLSEMEIRRIGFPWSEKMVERSRRSTGATIAASRAALSDGVSANLAGGTHHAFAGAGEGYCVFNDAAVAIRTLQQQDRIRRACVIDLDVHQGNGTASILSGDSSATTLSIHGVRNFPLRKVASDIDIALPDGTTDPEYLEALAEGLNTLLNHARFDLAIYLAGADPFVHDRLGRLSLSMNGLSTRDDMVFQSCRDANIPVAVVMAGGYAENVEDIVQIHSNTLRIASAFSESLA